MRLISRAISLSESWMWNESLTERREYSFIRVETFPVDEISQKIRLSFHKKEESDDKNDWISITLDDAKHLSSALNRAIEEAEAQIRESK